MFTHRGGEKFLGLFSPYSYFTRLKKENHGEARVLSRSFVYAPTPSISSLLPFSSLFHLTPQSEPFRVFALPAKYYGYYFTWSCLVLLLNSFKGFLFLSEVVPFLGPGFHLAFNVNQTSSGYSLLLLLKLYLIYWV